MYRCKYNKKRRNGDSGNNIPDNSGNNIPDSNRNDNNGNENNIEWNWEEIYKTAIKAGVRPTEFWGLTALEYNAIISGHIEKEKEKYKYDLKIAYYTGCFSQMEKPNELLNEIIAGIDQPQQSSEDILEFLKSMTNNMQSPIVDSGFKIPLDLIPNFNPDIKNYIYNHNSDYLKIYLPDTVISLDGEKITAKDSTYHIYLNKKSHIIKIKYNNAIYMIVAIRS